MGTIKIEGNYESGEKSGKWTGYHKDSTVSYIGNYLNGKKDSIWTGYHQNHIVSYKGKYINDNKSGIWSYYDNNGFKRVEGKFIDNIKNGKWEFSEPNGLNIEYTYTNDKLDGVWYIYNKDNLLGQGYFENGIENKNKTEFFYADTIYENDSIYNVVNKPPSYYLIETPCTVTEFYQCNVDPTFYEGSSAIQCHINNFLITNQKFGTIKRGRSQCFVSMVVNRNGQISDINIIKSFSEELDKELIKIAEQMKLWTPGLLNGNLVRTKYFFPFSFQKTTNPYP